MKGQNRLNSSPVALLMNLVKKLLVVHGDPKIRRQLVLLLAGTGFDVRSYGTAEAGLEGARSEWFDLAMVEHALGGLRGFSFVESLRKTQPTVPVVVLVQQLDLALVVKGIRLGIADVLLQTGDLRPLLRRVHGLLQCEPTMEAPAPEEVAMVAATLVGWKTGENSSAVGATSEPPSSELLRVSKEKAALEVQLERVARERTAYEAQLRTLLAQNHDLERLRATLADLHSEQETVRAAQALIDEKAGALAEQRTELARERQTVAAERAALQATTPPVEKTPSAADHDLDREIFASWRQELTERAEQLRAESTLLQQDRAQLAIERRRWHEDLDLLREEERNLHQYEGRLREYQASLEADRVVWSGERARPVQGTTLADEATLKEAWGKLQRATEILEAERAHLREDRLAFREQEKAFQKLEEAFHLRERQQAEEERRRREVIPVPEPVAPPPPPDSIMRSLTKAPFAVAKVVFGGGSS